MIRDAFLLASSASLAWGLADLLAGFWTRHLPVRRVLVQSELAGFLAIAIVALVFSPQLPRDSRLWWAALAGVASVPAMGLLYLAIRRGPLSVVAPIGAGAALVPVVWDMAGGVRPGVTALLGAGVALLGITLASLGSNHDERRQRVRRSLPYAALAALGLGFYFVLLNESASADPLWATVVARATGAGTAALLLAVPRRRMGALDEPGSNAEAGPGRVPRAVVVLAGVSAIGVLEAFADGAFASAAQLGGLGPAAVLSSLYPAVTVLLGVALLRERVRGVQAAGVVAALAGAALLGAG